MSYEKIKQHVGHELECVWYGDRSDPANVAIECLDCSCVLIDFDKPESEDKS